ncbi:imidazole glycerol phosphate synthase subunit HisH [Parvularcula sp. ZS-1/3]|uniref:Imidazole glycerol phosphate synthase subunit HisH n=1 Tax=Parvularcula mediterranea TaxID=2732508 RepID=A0A7Y3RND8_9PROT|nr:imidazole glycerol phosphate synthase subunit HisH [Parvularcula mediterranea]NNU17281.1 imidazole glycerol phosphate synthase subunit HisH [Parvularcula mediterranea]
MPTVCVIDYGAGNLHSAVRGLERAAPDASWRVAVSAEPSEVLAADRIVLPGVGAFASCAAGLRARPGLVDALVEATAERKLPFLGICVGMQLLADLGEEHGEVEGLGFVSGKVRALKADGLRLPHMGWNEVVPVADHPLLPPEGDAYFVHSFIFEATDESDIIAAADYGERFPAAVARENVAGAQFHPEKSGAYGQAFLKNFLEWRP